jgi:putative endonuclease
MVAKNRPSYRQQAEKRGRYAEGLACLMLRIKGYRILEQRYRTPYGEIDLIVFKNNTLIACEVKYRQTLNEGLWALGIFQRQRILRSLLHFYAGFSSTQNLDIRFDVMVITPWRWKHLKNAWSEDDV